VRIGSIALCLPLGAAIAAATYAGAGLIPRALHAGGMLHAYPNASRAPRADSAPDPWTDAQTVQPANLIKELGSSDIASRPLVACVGFRFLYEGAHIPGASFHGPGSKDEGIADLKKWAQGLPRSANVVLYCGCCPLVRCPNIRPAFSLMRDMGFKRLRVLVLPQDFATDWAGKGYRVEKDQ
jgi:thiosulfate/3-mercaptopyruvate sulfurtransferase